MEVVFSAVHYAHDYFYCNYIMQVTVSVVAVCDSSKPQLYSLFSDTLFS